MSHSVFCDPVSVTSDIPSLDELRVLVTWQLSDHATFAQEHGYQEIDARIRVGEGGKNAGYFEMKLRMSNNRNKTVEVFYKTHRSVFMTYVVSIGSVPSVIESTLTKTWVVANRWNLLTSLPKRTVLAITRNYVVINGDFLIHRSQEHDLHPAGLLLEPELSDIIIRSVDGDSIPALKYILARRSPVFKELLAKNSVEYMSNVVYSPFGSQVLKNLMSYTYVDVVPEIEDMAEKLLAAAHYYKLDGLKRLCEPVLERKLTLNNAIHMLEVSVLYNADRFNRACLKFITKGLAGNLSSTAEWNRLLSPDILSRIYEYAMGPE